HGHERIPAARRRLAHEVRLDGFERTHARHSDGALNQRRYEEQREGTLKTSAWMARIALITTHAAAGPSVQASSPPPTRCPLVPMPTGKLIIWAAKTNAPITPNRGTLASSNPRCAARTTWAPAGAAAASNEAH